ncbi:hypothetical protein, partial [Calidithermus roseus]|uniref:hypothetical protein n=1 Tax=Calidithermus roseus TaxID=1644118 RepID=UPI001FEA0F8E
MARARSTRARSRRRAKAFSTHEAEGTRPLCFVHSLENAGNSPDSYTLAATLPQGVGLSLQALDGTPLA